jgi:superfamily II DNA or RNA helicase
MSVFKLRPYQVEGKTEIRSLFKKDIKRVIFCSPTGSGKTVTFADISREAVKNGYKVLIIVDRKELLDQARSKLISYGLNPSIITAGRTGRSNNNSFIATVQTLVRRQTPQFDYIPNLLIVVDEAHKQIFDKVVLKDEYKDALVIGATATPYRTGKMTQLSDVYNEIVETVSIGQLIQDGFLVPAITYGAKVDTSKIKIKRGDYDTQELYKAFDKQRLYAGVIDKYNKFAAGTKAVCFNINVEHSKKVAASFNAAGISAVHLDGKTPKAERERILDSFAKGYFKVLCNVDVLTAGFDEWTIETIIVNLATKSLTKWLQMNGRGSRITPFEFKNNPRYLQKEHFNIIDMGGNVFSLGFWEQEREFSLTHKTKTSIDPAPVKTCNEDKEDINKKLGCGALVHLSAPLCKICGYIFPKEIKKEVESEFIQLENNQYLPPELIGKGWGSMNVEELEKVREIKGYKTGWIVRQILLNKDLELIDYARMKKYKSAALWVERMESMYIK